MGRAKVVYKKFPAGSAETKKVAASSASSPAPIQKKRGRPRKIIKEELPSEDKKPDTLSNDISQQSASDTGKKRSRTKKVDESAELRTEKSEETSRELSDEPAKPTFTRRQGSRRKSEPRRAAGAYLDSN